MPKLPPSPCRHPNCRLMAEKAGKCAGHYVKPKAWVSSQGKSATERGYGPEWRKRRKRILLRDRHLCQPCLRNDIMTQAKEVDHIVNKASGGTDDDENLEAICTPCHKKKTILERRGSGNRRII